MSSAIPKRDQNILCTRSGNRCAMPDCRNVLVVDKKGSDRESLIAEMAHIKGEKPLAARYDKTMTDKQRNLYENLILLCKNCHKMVDDQSDTYTVEYLYDIKSKHEQWVIESTEKEIINITFAELEVITKYLVSAQYEINESLIIIPPKEKIKKNNLSGKVENLITMGMTQVNQIRDYVEKSLDTDFGERLKQGFVKEYGRLRSEEGFGGDDLFFALFDFASCKSADFKQKAAGLAVLVYLFEMCEVFEK